jgi:hypothetical protein
MAKEHEGALRLAPQEPSLRLRPATATASSPALDFITNETVLALQRDAGNGATRDLVAVQRTKSDAKTFADQHGLVSGYSVNRVAAKRFISDKSKDKRVRAVSPRHRPASR